MANLVVALSNRGHMYVHLADSARITLVTGKQEVIQADFTNGWMGIIGEIRGCWKRSPEFTGVLGDVVHFVVKLFSAGAADPDFDC